MNIKFLLAGGFTALSLALSAGYVMGQNSEVTPYADIRDKAHQGGYENISALAFTFMFAPGSAARTQEIIHTAQVERTNPVSQIDLLCLQAAQNEKIIEQNAQILAALKAQKPPAKAPTNAKAPAQ